MGRRWTDEEIQFLKFAYPNKEFTMDEINNAFDDRTKNQIVAKANSLGLIRYKEELPNGFKRCSRCDMILPLDQFSIEKKNKTDGRTSHCRRCDCERKKWKTIESGKTMNSGKTKKCSTCNETKPLSEFTKHKKTKDGFTTICKDCRREYDRKRLVRGGY